ncbi:hypothetical protein ACFL6F_01650 [Planctomycetota bacterium]
MVITFNCQYCDRFLKVEDKHRGQKVKCPECDLSLTVPDQSLDKQYLIAKEGGTIGPIKFIEIADMVSKGNLRGSEMVAVFGTEQFKPVKEYQEFSELAKIAFKKATKKTTSKTIKTLIKLAVVVVLIIGFIMVKQWWDDREVSIKQDDIYSYLRRTNRKALAQAIKSYEIMAKDFPDHKRTIETKKEIDNTEKKINELEIEKYKKIKISIDKMEKKALQEAQKNKFGPAYREVRKIKDKSQGCKSIGILKSGPWRDDCNDTLRRHLKLRAELDKKRDIYVKAQLKIIDELVVAEDFKAAKDILHKLNKMDLGPQLTRTVTNKATDIFRKTKGLNVTKEKKPEETKTIKQLSTAVSKDLQSGDTDKIRKAFETITVTKKKLNADEKKIFIEVAEKSLKNKKLYFPAVDAILVVGDPKGKLFREIFENYQRMVTETKNKKEIAPCSRSPHYFAGDLVAYTGKHGGMDKGIFLASLFADPKLASGILKQLKGHIDIKDLPNLRKAIEKIIINSENTGLIKEAIRALGSLKSSESLDMLVKIIDYSTCPKCTFGGEKSGHTHNYANLFCARCRNSENYSRKGSIFNVTLQAVREIGSSKPLQTLRKLKEKENAVRHKGTADLIGNIIEDITKSR